MASGEQQLKGDFELVKKLLRDYPSIKLVASKGDPPEQYDIEYSLKGYRAHPDGTVLPANKHQVRITLPFGYPLFPPTAKPLTSIFHPDIDPDAIRIADFWKEKKSLPALIIHIGEMICGTFYSGDPFNQRAYDWFEERKSWMPFDILEPHEGSDDEGPAVLRAPAPPAPPAAGAAPAETQESEEISLAFADEGETSVPGAAESAELGDLLDGEFSFAFDLDAEPGETATGLPETTASSEVEGQDLDLGLGLEQDQTEINFEDLTFQQEEEAPSFAGGEDLAAEQEENAPLDFGLHLEEESVPTAAGPADQAGGEEIEFASSFALPAEEAPPPSESIELGDLAGLDSIDFSGLEPETPQEEETFSGFAAEPSAEEEPTIDFGIAGADLSPAARASAAPAAEAAEAADEGLLGGFSLQLDDAPAAQASSQAGNINALIERKEIFTAKKILADLHDPGSVPEREAMEHTISDLIHQAEDLFRKADALEQSGELEKAGLHLDLVANIAVDYPGLEFARNRIREAVVAGGQKKGAEADSGAVAATPRKRGLALPGLRLPSPLILGVLVLVALAGGGTMLFLKDSDRLAKARTEFSRGQLLVEKKDFKEADRAFSAARAELDAVLLLRAGEKNKIGQDIDAIASRQPFKEGLQGRVLYNGQYVTVEAAKAIDLFNLHRAAAENARQAGNLDQALASYEKSLEFAEKGGLQEKTADIRQTISTLRLQQAVSQARKAEEDKEWKKAADTYQKALELSSSLAKPEEQGQIAQHLAAASLRHELDESRRAFTASEWEKTVEMLQRVQKIIADNPTIVTAAEKTEISKLLINASVYQILSDAKKAFTERDWDGAVKEYEKAIALLREQKDILGPDEVADGVAKIEKTVLMTRITREQNHIESGSGDTAVLQANLEHYRTIIGIVEKSSLPKDAILEEIVANAKDQTEELEKAILVGGKIDYLKANYETIFRENYPAAKASALSNPQATFIKREGNILIFTLRCVERSGGRTARLELNYQYDLDQKSWSLYPGRL